jgi:hypothetical protein
MVEHENSEVRVSEYVGKQERETMPPTTVHLSRHETISALPLFTPTVRRYVLSLMAALAPSISLCSAMAALPDEPNDADLALQYPQFTSTMTLPYLRHYRVQLEAYRVGVLELYNKTIQEFTSDLADYSKQLESAKASQTISIQEYEQLSTNHARALKRCSPTGALMKNYVNYLAKYQGDSKWVNAEIRRLERLI